MKAVLDTHAAIHLALGSRALGASARALVTGLAPFDLVLSDVSLTEVARLLHAGGIKAGGDPLAWLETLATGYHVQPVTPVIAWKAAAYAFAHRDPCDRHILATADALGLPLVTVDRVLAKAAQSIGVGVVW